MGEEPGQGEADHGRVPLIVCTADRPPELRDVGAGQTIDQTHLYGRSVRWFFDPGPPDDGPGAGRLWRSLAARSVGESNGAVPGPVHLNLPFRGPLVPTGAPLVEAPDRYVNPLLLVGLTAQLVQAILVGVVAGRLFGAVGVAVAAAIDLVAVFVVAASLPRTWAVLNTERVALAATRPVTARS